jgi:uncharacterized protein YbjT (DUF2867 family)
MTTSTTPTGRPTVLVTAAGGTIGAQVLHRLRRHPVQIRALLHRPTGTPPPDDIDAHYGDLGDPSTLDRACAGVDAMFLACGNVPAQVELECKAIDAATAAGVGMVVKLSAQGAEPRSPVAFWNWHAQIEQHLQASGLRSVVLRPSFLMSNLCAGAPQLAHLGAVVAPAGAARISMVDPVDVAAAAVAVLTGRGPDGAAFVLTGPRAVDYPTVAHDLSVVLGRTIRFVDVPPEAARASLVEAGVPAFAADQVVAVFAALRTGLQSVPTDAVRLLTGRDPGSLRDFVRRHAGVFGAPTAVSAPA